MFSQDFNMHLDAAKPVYRLQVFILGEQLLLQHTTPRDRTRPIPHISAGCNHLFYPCSSKSIDKKPYPTLIPLVVAVDTDVLTTFISIEGCWMADN